MTATLPVYRRSELESIADGCLFRYKAIWVDGVDDSSDISLIGQTFARVKYLYVMRLVENGLTSDWEESRAAFTEGVADTHLPARLIPELHTVWDFHAAKFELDLDRFITAEEHGSTGGVAFTPDLVLGHPEANAIEIVDDKSGWHPPLTEAELKGSFQARVYSRYARDRWPNFKEYRFTLYAVRFNKRTTVTFDQAELDAVDIEIESAIAALEHAKAANEWPAIPGPACRFCTLKCPVADEPLAQAKRLSETQYADVGRIMIPLEKEIRNTKKALKAAVATFGPLSINGVVWDNRPSVSKSYPIDAVLEGMRKLKIDRQAAEVMAAGGDMSISHSGLKQIFKLFPELERVLEPSVKTRTTYRFSAQKPGDEEEDE